VGDVEELPYKDGEFDVVVSQFGHMFAPRPEIAVREMLRVLKPGGTIAFSTWPPELLVGRMFAMNGRYAPPPPPGASPPHQWGDPNIVRDRLGDAVTDLFFDRDVMYFQILSPQHQRVFLETNVGPVAKLVEGLGRSDPAKLAAFRAELEQLMGLYFEDNRIKQDYLLTRARKR
jgi:SAM-dependent methyltransferase